MRTDASNRRKSVKRRTAAPSETEGIGRTCAQAVTHGPPNHRDSSICSDDRADRSRKFITDLVRCGASAESTKDGIQ